MNVLMELEKSVIRRDLPEFRAGDTVAVHYKIKEGDRERIQVFEGVVIAIKGGGAGETFIVRKVSYGVGVERIFPLNSPLIDKIVVKRLGKVRRAKLYYLRGRSKKASRIRERARLEELRAQGFSEAAALEEIVEERAQEEPLAAEGVQPEPEIAETAADTAEETKTEEAQQPEAKAEPEQKKAEAPDKDEPAAEEVKSEEPETGSDEPVAGETPAEEAIEQAEAEAKSKETVPKADTESQEPEAEADAETESAEESDKK